MRITVRSCPGALTVEADGTWGRTATQLADAVAAAVRAHLGAPAARYREGPVDAVNVPLPDPGAEDRWDHDDAAFPTFRAALIDQLADPAGWVWPMSPRKEQS